MYSAMRRFIFSNQRPNTIYSFGCPHHPMPNVIITVRLYPSRLPTYAIFLEASPICLHPSGALRPQVTSLPPATAATPGRSPRPQTLPHLTLCYSARCHCKVDKKLILRGLISLVFVMLFILFLHHGFPSAHYLRSN